MKKSPIQKTKKSTLLENNSEAFIEAARELGCDDDPAHFDEMLKKVARHKPADGDKPDKAPPKKGTKE
jgi:hypothetical protein